VPVNNVVQIEGRQLLCDIFYNLNNCKKAWDRIYSYVGFVTKKREEMERSLTLDVTQLRTTKYALKASIKGRQTRGRSFL